MKTKLTPLPPLAQAHNTAFHKQVARTDLWLFDLSAKIKLTYSRSVKNVLQKKEEA